HYNIHVANTGDVTLTGLTVTDPLTGNPVSAGTLAVGGFEELAGSHTITPATVDKHGANAFYPTADNQITKTATATSSEAGPVSSSVDTPINYAPGISIAKTVTSVTDIYPLSLHDALPIFHYNIHVANTGDVTLTGLTVTDPLTGNPVSAGTLAVGGFE